MSENASTGLPARAPKQRDESSSVAVGGLPVERLQQVKEGVAGVSDAVDDIVVVDDDA